MANEVRGEVEFTIGGRTFTLIPSFEIVAALETEYEDLFKLWGKIVSGAITPIARVIQLASKQDKKRSLAQIGDFIIASNANEFRPHVGKFIRAILNGLSTDEPRDEVEASGGDDSKSEQA